MEIILQPTVNDIDIQTVIYCILGIFCSEVKSVLTSFIGYITCKFSLLAVVCFLFHPIISISKLKVIDALRDLLNSGRGVLCHIDIANTLVSL